MDRIHGELGHLLALELTATLIAKIRCAQAHGLGWKCKFMDGNPAGKVLDGTYRLFMMLVSIEEQRHVCGSSAHRIGWAQHWGDIDWIVKQVLG